MSSWTSSCRPRVAVDAVLCAIALDEEPYLDEWIRYHLSIGFSHIYLYDNSAGYVLHSKQSSRVTVRHFPGPKRHLEAYDIFVVQYRFKHRWAAFMDCDEFLVLHAHHSVTDFLNSYSDCPCIGLNWKMFGTSGQLCYEDKPVTERFQRCAAEVNPHIKCIAQLHAVDRYVSSHFPKLKSGVITDTRRNVIHPPFHAGDTDVACIHHYYTKSEEEFRKKILRGTSDEHPARSLSELDAIHEKNNDVVNTDAWEWYRAH